MAKHTTRFLFMLIPQVFSENKLKEYKVICPLINFQIPNILTGPFKITTEEIGKILHNRKEQLIKGIEIIDGVKIRRISKEDIDEIKRYPFTIPSIESLSSVQFVLEKNIIVDKQHDFQVDSIMRNTILALRLLKPGYVSGNYIFYISLSGKSRLTEWSREEGQRLNYLGFPYVLNFDDIPTLKSLVRKLQKIDFTKHKRLNLACKRFQRAYEEQDPEDQLVDLIIAFEALFVRKEIKGASKKQKIVNACSSLLGKNEKERKKIRNILSEAYSIRNHIVHGTEYQKKKADDMDYFPNLVSEVENCLRESIKKLLDQKSGDI